MPEKLIPVFAGQADVRGSHGGRGSGKTRSFAKMTAVRAYMWDMAGREGIILCGRQFMNSLSDSSLEEITAAIKSEPWLEQHFEIGAYIAMARTPELIMQMPASIWRTLELMSVLMNVDADLTRPPKLLTEHQIIAIELPVIMGLTYRAGQHAQSAA